MLVAGAFAPAAASAAAPTPGLYAVDSAASFVHVRVYRAGLLGRLGHNHVVAHRDISGCLQVADELADSRVALRLPLTELVVDDSELREAAGDAFPVPVPPKDIVATRRNMLGDDLLAAAAHPVATVDSRRISGQYPELDATVEIGLRGVRHPLSMPLQVLQDADTITVSGTRAMRHEELGLEPFTAALGTLRVADTLDFDYRLRFRPAPAEMTLSDCKRAAAIVDDDGIALADDPAK